MATFATDKLFLDQSGLIALIEALAKLKKTLQEGIDKNAEDITSLTQDLADLEAIVAKIAVFEDDALVSGVLKEVKDLAELLKSYITSEDVYDVENKGTIIARLDAIDEQIAAIKKANPVTKITADGVPDEVNALNFHVTHMDETTESFAIDCSKFVVDGFLKQTYLVYINGTKVIDVATNELIDVYEDTNFRSTIPATDNADGTRYFIFVFNSDTVTHGGAQYIWVNLEDLHDSYSFKSADADYVDVSVAAHDKDGAENAVTLTVGDSVKTAADGFPDLKAQVEDHETRLTAAEGTIKDHTATLEDHETRIKTNENNIYNIQNYLAAAAIKTDDVTNFFNYIVLGQGATPTWTTISYNTKTEQSEDSHVDLTGPAYTE